MGSKGTKHHSCKLTPEQVREIRIRIARGQEITEIARIYDVAQSAISQIKSGRNWGWLK